jgi:hypothetical protein
VKPRVGRTRGGGRIGQFLVIAALCSGANLLAASAAPAASKDATAQPAECGVTALVPYAAPVFLGYACRDRECNAHKSGFAWAERNAVTDARECVASPNPAFVEGCRAFVEEAVTPEQAGFEWARENELDATCRCRGGGAGFEAGCAAYVTESGR